MKITRLTTFEVPPRWLFLKIETDEGITGWGEPVVEGRAHTVAAASRSLSDYLVGKDPRNIEDHWQVMYRGGFYRGGPILMSAIAGIDQALWDIKGKASWRAGPRSCSAARCAIASGSTPGSAAIVRLTRQRPRKRAVDRGFTAVKMNGTEELQIIDTCDKVEAALERVAAVREAVGPNVGIGVDFHGRVHKPMAKVLLKELEPYQLMFIEEPVLSENVEALPEIARQYRTPIALGERLYSRWDFKYDLRQRRRRHHPARPSHAGGITETRKIATMAEAYDVARRAALPARPDCACRLPADRRGHATTPFIQEQSLGIHYNTGNDLLDYLTDPSVFDYEEGFVAIPTGPGLGIDVNEEYVNERAEQGHRWRNPIWRHADGSIAEW